MRWVVAAGLVMLVVAAVAIGAPSVEPWSGSQEVKEVDVAGELGSDVSGLTYERGVMWAVDNGDGKLLRLVKNGSTWVRDPANGWAAGKVLKYPEGAGTPDAEGVTLTNESSVSGVYVSTERNGADDNTSRMSVLRYVVAGDSMTLTATREWNLTPDLPAVDPNKGLESIAWVPDQYLTASGLYDESAQATYDPLRYPEHGGGLFFVGLEANGMIYAYALDQNAGTFTRVATFASGFPTVADLHWDTDDRELWVECDDNCDGRVAVFGVDVTTANSTKGRFVSKAIYDRPTGMANLDNEGFTIAPQTKCDKNYTRPVFWADDGNADGHVLREGRVLGCPSNENPITPTPTATTTAEPSPTMTAAPTPTAAPGRKRCRVPDVRGLKLPKAKHRIRAAGCKIGTVTRKGKRRLRVTRQRPRAGRRVARGTAVNLRLSTG